MLRAIATDPTTFKVLAKSAVAVSCAADTAENTLATITVPAGAMGPNGILRIRGQFSYTNGANNKTMRIRWSGIGGTALGTSTQTATAAAGFLLEIANRNATNSQFIPTASFGFSPFGTTTGGQTTAVDTTASTTIVITGQKASAGDTLTLEFYTVELIP